MYIIQADIRGKNYWLKEMASHTLYDWVGIIQNATLLSELEAEQWKRYLILNHVSWPIDIIPYN
jgi:hypothetical protein